MGPTGALLGPYWGPTRGPQGPLQGTSGAPRISHSPARSHIPATDCMGPAFLLHKASTKRQSAAALVLHECHLQMALSTHICSKL